MARIRSVKPEIRSSLTVGVWPREVRYLFVLLWGYLDDYGRGVDDPRLIKADCLPLDDDVTADVVDRWLDMMATPELGHEPASLCRYEVNGRHYLHCPRWSEHQRPQHPRDSRIPACNRGEACGSPHEDVTKPHEDRSDESFGNTTTTCTSVSSDVEGEVEGDVASEAAFDGDDGSDLREDVERLCEHLADRIEANGSARPTIGRRWHDDARLMLDRDGRTEQQIHAAIDWCQSDPFWRANILSMRKLREKFDQLRLQASRQQARASPRMSTADRRVADALALAAELQDPDLAPDPPTVRGEVLDDP